MSNKMPLAYTRQDGERILRLSDLIASKTRDEDEARQTQGILTKLFSRREPRTIDNMFTGLNFAGLLNMPLEGFRQHFQHLYCKDILGIYIGFVYGIALKAVSDLDLAEHTESCRIEEIVHSSLNYSGNALDMPFILFRGDKYERAAKAVSNNGMFGRSSVWFDESEGGAKLYAQKHGEEIVYVWNSKNIALWKEEDNLEGVCTTIGPISLNNLAPDFRNGAGGFCTKRSLMQSLGLTPDMPWMDNDWKEIYENGISRPSMKLLMKSPYAVYEIWCLN